MKKILLFLIFPCLLFSQEDKLTIDAAFGLMEDGTALIAKANYPVFEKFEFQGGVSYSFTRDYYEVFKVPYTNVSLNLGLSKDVFTSLNRKFVAKVGLGGLVGYETVTIDEELQNYLTLNLMSSNMENKVVYGAFGNAQINYVLSHFFSLNLLANQFYYANSDLGNLNLFAGIGLTFHIF